jgi:hypothetical protein
VCCAVLCSALRCYVRPAYSAVNRLPPRPLTHLASNLFRRSHSLASVGRTAARLCNEMALSAIHDALPLTPMSPTAGQSLISSPTTSFLPLRTPWPLIGECSSLFVSQTSLNGLYAFDPYLPTQSSIQCLPPEATAWWDQFTAPGATPTVLGGVSLVCPQAYTTAATSVIDSSTTLVGCCPL